MKGLIRKYNIYKLNIIDVNLTTSELELCEYIFECFDYQRLELIDNVHIKYYYINGYFVFKYFVEEKKISIYNGIYLGIFRILRRNCKPFQINYHDKKTYNNVIENILIEYFDSVLDIKVINLVL